jgi:hypothetical protein
MDKTKPSTDRARLDSTPWGRYGTDMYSIRTSHPIDILLCLDLTGSSEDEAGVVDADDDDDDSLLSTLVLRTAAILHC